MTPGPIPKLVFAALVAVAACVGTGPVHRAVLPPVPGDVVVDAQPVELTDLSGRVRSIAAAETEATNGANIDTRTLGNQLWVQWLAGACESRSRLTLGPSGGGFKLRVQTDGDLVLGCPAIGIPRAIVITFDAPIDGAPVVATVER